MIRTFLTVALASQMAAGVAFGQASDAAVDTTNSGTPMGPFGSDWSETLVSAVFGEDGTTVRPESQLVSEWASLSEDDKIMLRRDCTLHEQYAGGVSASAGTQAGESVEPKEDGGTAAQSNTEASDSVGSATGITDTAEGSPGTQAGIDTTTDTSVSNSPISVSNEQMDQICAATQDL